MYAIAHLLIIYGADVNAVAVVRAVQGVYFWSVLVGADLIVVCLAQHDEMPLTCAEQASQSDDTVDMDKNRLLIALLETHNARRTWRRNNQKQQQHQQCRQDAAASVSKILSFSGSFSFQYTSDPQRELTSVDVSAIAEAETLEAASRVAGIMLDTPEL